MLRTLLFFSVLIFSVFANGILAYRLWTMESPPIKRVETFGEPVLMRTEGGLLEVSRIRAEEVFEASKEHTFLGVSMGKTVSHIRVPATYRYHIALAPEWKIFFNSSQFVVIAPAVQPSLPVAIDTAKLEKHVSGVWSLLTGENQLEALQRGITADLAEKSVLPKYIELQRETARKTLQEFVLKWVSSQAQWQDAKNLPIKVLFADEPITKALEDKQAPPPS